LRDLARGAWDRTAAVVYAVACSSFGGLKNKSLRPDDLNPYRAGKKTKSLAEWFGGLRQRKDEQDRRAQTNGATDGG